MQLTTLIKLFFLFNISHAAKSECQTTRFKYIHNQQKKSMIFEACKIKNFYFSKGCYKKPCKIKTEILNNLNFKFGPVGSPHFLVCHKSKGVPIIGEIQNVWEKEKNYESLTLCFDHTKTEFISGNYILSNVFKKKK